MVLLYMYRELFNRHISVYYIPPDDCNRHINIGMHHCSQLSLFIRFSCFVITTHPQAFSRRLLVKQVALKNTKKTVYGGDRTLYHLLKDFPHLIAFHLLCLSYKWDYIHQRIDNIIRP